MNITPLNVSSRRTLWPCVLLLLGPVLTGCGGGGGGSTPSTMTLAQTAKITLSGTLLDATGAPLVGYKVVYTPAVVVAHLRHAEDTGDTFSAVTDSQGRYTLSIPASDATPGSTLAVYDTTGAQVQSQTITLDPTQPVQTTVTTVTPPPITTTTTTPTTGGAGPPPAPPVPPI